jgi:hypothetical protein
MFRTAKNLIILYIIFDGPIVDPGPYYKGTLVNLLAQVADEMGLYEYPKGVCYSDVRAAWRLVDQSNGRPLSEMLRFPQGRIGDTFLYYHIMVHLIYPHEMYCRERALVVCQEDKEYWLRRAEYLRMTYKIYDCLDDLNRDKELYQKRLILAQLLNLIGDEMYHAGRFPNAWPD